MGKKYMKAVESHWMDFVPFFSLQKIIKVVGKSVSKVGESVTSSPKEMDRIIMLTQALM